MNPRVRVRLEQDRRIRSAYDAKLDRLGRTSKHRFQGTVLVDGKWDNPHYWFRYALLRSALGCSHGREIGLLGSSRRNEQARTMKQFGFSKIHDLLKHKPDFKTRDLATQLSRSVQTPEDILRLELPYGFPADTFYDSILKLQRQAFVQVDHPQLHDVFVQCLVNLDAANEILDRYQPRLVVSSHAIGVHACLAWLALQRGIPTVIPFGDVGVSKFWRPRGTQDFYDFFDRVTWREYQSLPDVQKIAAQETGKAYIRKRLAGDISNVGAFYAYTSRNAHFDRSDVCRRFGWDLDQPVIAVYTSNWFDFPHTTGMKGFRDYYDWTIQTIRVAQEQKNVNWIFKGHPANERYGSITLEDVVGSLDTPICVWRILAGTARRCCKA